MIEDDTWYKCTICRREGRVGRCCGSRGGSMKVIIMTKHDRHTDNEVRIFKFSEENITNVKKEMEKHWTDGQYGYFGDLPSDGGIQFGWGEDYYSSYAICELVEI